MSCPSFLLASVVRTCLACSLACLLASAGWLACVAVLSACIVLAFAAAIAVVQLDAATHARVTLLGVITLVQSMLLNIAFFECRSLRLFERQSLNVEAVTF